MIVDIDLNDIDGAIQALTKIKELHKKEEKWQPKGGKYFVSVKGNVVAGVTTKECRNFGMEFKTRETAAKAYKAYRKYHRLYKLAEELNDGWNPDLNNDLQPKFVIAKRKGKYICYQINILEFIDSIYFKSKEAAEKAIKILDQEYE